MSKKIILRQSVKSGVAVVFFFGLGMASINAQTTQTTQPTGKVGINTTNPTETLDVKGKVRIQELYTDNQQTGTNNATFTATNVVTVDNNGVLGKKTLSSITAAQTPNLPWKKVASTDNAVPAEGLKIYSKYAVGIGDYSAAGSSVGSSFEINGGGTSQLGLINGTNKWDISTEDQNLTFTKRKPEAKQGRMFSLTENAVMYLGYKMSHSDGSGAKLILDGGNGKIGINQNSASYNLDVAGDAKISGLKTTDDNITNGSTTSKYSPAKMVVVDANGVLGKQDFPTIPTEPWQVAGGTTQANANSQDIYQSGKVGIGNFGTGKSLSNQLEVAGNTSITGTLELNSSSNKYKMGLSGKSLMFSNTAGHYTAALTNEAVLYLGKPTSNNNTTTTIDANGQNAKIIINGADGRIGINTNENAKYNLNVNGDAKISGLKSGNGYTATHMVVTDANGVLGKQDFPTIPTIPTEPWQVAGGTTQANANSQNIYQSGKVGIGDFGTGKSLTEKLEVIGNTSIKGQLNLIDADSDNTDFLLYSKGTQLLFDKKITVPTIGTSATQTGVTAALTNVGKLYLGSGLTSSSNNIYSENAKILLDGQDGKVAIGHNNPAEALDVKGKAKIQTIEKQTATTGLDMVVVGADGILKKADIPTGGGSGNGVKNHTGSNDAVKCNAANAGTIHYKEGVTVNGQPTSVMGFCMKTASTSNKYRWFYIFGGAGTTAGSEADAPNFGEGIQ